MEAAIIKQRVLVEDVKKAAANAGNEKDKQNQLDPVIKERNACSNQVRLLNDENRQVLRQLNEEIKPNLNAINSKIAKMENSKNVKLEVITRL